MPSIAYENMTTIISIEEPVHEYGKILELFPKIWYDITRGDDGSWKSACSDQRVLEEIQYKIAPFIQPAYKENGLIIKDYETDDDGLWDGSDKKRLSVDFMIQQSPESTRLRIQGSNQITLKPTQIEIHPALLTAEERSHPESERFNETNYCIALYHIVHQSRAYDTELSETCLSVPYQYLTRVPLYINNLDDKLTAEQSRDLSGMMSFLIDNDFMDIPIMIKRAWTRELEEIVKAIPPS